MRPSAVLLASLSRAAPEAEATKPLILLFGWLGSRERHVQKYASAWEELGAQPLVHRPSILQTAVPALADAAAVDFASRVSAAFAQRREAAGGAPPDVLVQVMSGAGFLAYGTLCHLTMLAAGRGGGSPGSSGSHACALPHRLLAEPRAAAALAAMPKVMAATRGVVVDSAPPPFQPGIWSRGFLAALLSTEAYGLERRHPLALRAAHELTERYTSLPSVALRMREVRAAWAAAVPPCPQLYLYSTIDPLIPYQHVELFQEQQERRGVEVHSHCWTDSGHCDHLRCHPQQYRQLLRSFSEHVLKGDINAAGSWI